MQAACCVEGACLALLLLLSSACRWSRNKLLACRVGPSKAHLAAFGVWPVVSMVKW